MNEGTASFRLGLRGCPAAAEANIVERDVYAGAADSRGRGCMWRIFPLLTR